MAKSQIMNPSEDVKYSSVRLLFNAYGEAFVGEHR